MNFTEKHKKDFEQNGFTIVEGILTPDESKVMRDIIIDLADAEKKNNSAYYYNGHFSNQRVWNLLNKDASFRELIQLPFLMNTMDWIFRRDTIHHKYFLSSLQANILYPGAPAQKLHIDTPVPEPLPSWIIKANSIWLLDDFTASNGATEVLPGSHKFPYKPKAEDQNRTDIKIVNAPAGSVLITHGALWHRNGSNRSNRARIALLGSFSASFVREIASEEDYFKVLDPIHIDNASKNLRLVLGADHGIKQGAKSSNQN